MAKRSRKLRASVKKFFSPATKGLKKFFGRFKLPDNKFGRVLRVVLVPWPLRPIGRYLNGSRKELKQVKWPSRKDTWKLTFAVVVFTTFFVIITAAADFGLSKLVERILL